MPSYWGSAIQYIADQIEDDKFFSNGEHEQLLGFLFEYAISKTDDDSDTKEFVEVRKCLLVSLYLNKIPH